MQSSSALKTCTLIPKFSKISLVLGKPSIIIHFPGDIVRILVLNVLLDKNSSSGALIIVNPFFSRSLNNRGGVWGGEGQISDRAPEGDARFCRIKPR